jgi:hypothetical protein
LETLYPNNVQEESAMAMVISFSAVGATGHTVRCGDLLTVTVVVHTISRGGVAVVLPEQSPCFFVWRGMRTKIMTTELPRSGADTVVFRPLIDGRSDVVEVTAVLADNSGRDSATDRLVVRC